MTTTDVRELLDILGIDDVPQEEFWHPFWSLVRELARRVGDDGPEYRQVLDRLAARSSGRPFRDLARLPGIDALEAAHGGFQQGGEPLLNQDELTLDAVQSLFGGHTNMVHVRGFAGEAVRRRLLDGLAARPLEIWRYGEKGGQIATDVFTVGMPAQNIVDSDTAQRYHAQDFELLRHLAKPFLSPLDELRLMLDEYYSGGATVQGGRDGKRRLAGIVRIYRPCGEHPDLCDASGRPRDSRGTEGYVHVDAVQSTQIAFYSANIYLEMPSDGAELSLFNVRPPCFAASRYGDFVWDLLINFTAHSIALESLSSLNTIDPDICRRLFERMPPPVIVRPAPGDLILLNPAVPHSVRDMTGGQRVSIQSFIKCVAGAPLRMLA